jgi:antagonist of KipI
VERVKALEVISPGPLATIQDLGRYGLGRYGVPPSGALDPFSLRVANLLVGNREDEACIETTLMGLRVRAFKELVIAITGGDLQPHLNDAPSLMWRSLVVRKDDVLHFKALKAGCRAYLAMGGGINLHPVLGSKSTNLTSGFGGHEGRHLRKGDILYTTTPIGPFNSTMRALDQDRIPVYTKDWVLRILWGPQDEDFPPESKFKLLDSLFKVTPMSDRTGIRLSGPPIHRKEGINESIISEGVVPGSIQVPGDGQPIIILVETVTGGYRKIATIIGADIPLLGQIKPGDHVLFRAVSQEQALFALRETEQIIETLRR